jgi:hypothetical protein
MWSEFSHLRDVARRAPTSVISLEEGMRMSLQGKQTAAWFQRASGALINGGSSQFRYWGDEDVAQTLHVFEESLTEALGEM